MPPRVKFSGFEEVKKVEAKEADRLVDLYHRSGCEVYSEALVKSVVFLTLSEAKLAKADTPRGQPLSGRAHRHAAAETGPLISPVLIENLTQIPRGTLGGILSRVAGKIMDTEGIPKLSLTARQTCLIQCSVNIAVGSNAQGLFKLACERHANWWQQHKELLEHNNKRPWSENERHFFRHRELAPSAARLKANKAEAEMKAIRAHRIKSPLERAALANSAGEEKAKLLEQSAERDKKWLQARLQRRALRKAQRKALAERKAAAQLSAQNAVGDPESDARALAAASDPPPAPSSSASSIVDSPPQNQRVGPRPFPFRS